MTAPTVSLRGVTKRFPGVLANDRIDLDLWPGEVHVLLGENGAGKSTLIGMLAGMQQPDEGSIAIAGAETRIRSPRHAIDLGIGTVYQHVLLVPSLSVLDNLMLGGPWWRRLARGKALRRFRELSETLGVTLDPDTQVQRLSLGQQQQVEIMRALWRDARVLILDEPTSMLTPQGVEELGKVMARLKAQGTALVFITHKLREAYAFGDRISVLRLGKKVGDLPPDALAGRSEEAVTEEVIRLMFGTAKGHEAEAATLAAQETVETPHRKVTREGRPLLEVAGLSTMGERGETGLDGIDLDLWPGEVLGIAGVDGNGQKHLAEVLAGQRPPSGGGLTFDGAEIGGLGVPERRRLGIRYITDERLGEGTVGGFSVAINLAMKETGRPPLWRQGFTLWPKVHGHARAAIAKHDVRTPSERTPIAKLSGGNIQKVMLARELGGELAEAARLVIFNKPTYGLDLQNTRLARQRIVETARQGVAAVVISTELDELLEVSDRIAVLFNGRLTGIVEVAPGVEKAIGRYMTGAAA